MYLTVHLLQVCRGTPFHTCLLCPWRSKLSWAHGTSPGVQDGTGDGMCVCKRMLSMKIHCSHVQHLWPRTPTGSVLEQMA